MNTLLLRLAAPLQSWGVRSNFETRTTESYPSKSGVIGMVAAALGRPRDADLSDLNALTFGIRVDQEGILSRDFHTAHGKADYVTNRYYLSDAVFLVGLACEDRAMLLNLEQALGNPAFPLFLGRRSCPPSGRLSLGLREKDLMPALREEPWQAASWYSKKWMRKHPGQSPALRIVTDSDASDPFTAPFRDLARSFSPYHREYSFRSVTDQGYHVVNERRETEHDPFLELEDLSHVSDKI